MHNLSWFAAFHRVLRQSADIRCPLLDRESMFPMLYDLRCYAIYIVGEL
jgi:polyphosphate kinase